MRVGLKLSKKSRAHLASITIKDADGYMLLPPKSLGVVSKKKAKD